MGFERLIIEALKLYIKLHIYTFFWGEQPSLYIFPNSKSKKNYTYIYIYVCINMCVYIHMYFKISFIEV